jgi:hypothetical protein
VLECESILVAPAPVVAVELLVHPFPEDPFLCENFWRVTVG